MLKVCNVLFLTIKLVIQIATIFKNIRNRSRFTVVGSRLKNCEPTTVNGYKHIMRLYQNPLFRKEIAPWYDSDTTCLIMIGFLLIIFLFGIAGISEAYKKIDYHKYVWVPGILLIMSGGIIISTSIRLLKRYYKRRATGRHNL